MQFCNRCRWLHRATWVQTELFLTFPDTQAEEPRQEKEGAETSNGSKYSTNGKGLKAITLIPCNAPETGGRFRVWLQKEPASDSSEDSRQASQLQAFEDGAVVLLWDRKIKGGFPELKELKQLIRDEIAPAHKLGHSDKK
jgi:selT/selW/selH-like putative selenoprotein